MSSTDFTGLGLYYDNVKKRKKKKIKILKSNFKFENEKNLPSLL